MTKGMATDVEIAQQFTPQPITSISDALGIEAEYLYSYGHDIAKIDLKALATSTRKKGRLILVSAPTPSGECKTTSSLGWDKRLLN